MIVVFRDILFGHREFVKYLIVFEIPIIVQVLYLIKLDVFGIPGKVSLFFIKYWISNLTPLISGIYFFNRLLIYGDITGAIYFLLFGSFFSYKTIVKSKDAIRHIDPEWDKVEGDYYYPSLLYTFGVFKYKSTEHENNEDEETKESIEGVAI